MMINCSDELVTEALNDTVALASHPAKRQLQQALVELDEAVTIGRNEQ